MPSSKAFLDIPHPMYQSQYLRKQFKRRKDLFYLMLSGDSVNSWLAPMLWACAEEEHRGRRAWQSKAAHLVAARKQCMFGGWGQDKMYSSKACPRNLISPGRPHVLISCKLISGLIQW
jgi:hypothetical protein